MELHEEDWELINEDGFVYKRLKRHPVHPTITTVSTAPPPDPAAEERNRKKRKKMALLKLKTRYQQEILNWELLSNTLKVLQDRTQAQLSPVLPDLPVAISTEHSSDSMYGEIAETLLAQVEAQEAFGNEISTLCDVAESLCNAQERLLKQPLFYLPILGILPTKVNSIVV